MNESLFPEKPGFMKHPLIKPDTVEQRLYQLNLAGKALEGSSLVVLPTGLGKTIIALFVIVSRLQRFGGKVLILSPTKPLVEQHATFFKNVMALPEEEVMTFTGSIAPAEREKLWAQGKVIVSTPQVIENDLLTKRISLEDVSHITFDEAHRAVGNYAYTFIAEKYFESAKNPHVLGITASPGSSDEKISEVCQALHVENVSVKTEKDRDVRPYVQEKEIEWFQVQLPSEMAEIRGYLEKIFDDRLGTIRGLGFSPGSGKYVSKKDLLLFQKKLQGEIRVGGDPAVFTAMSVLAEMVKVNHAVEMVETQGLGPLRKYLEKLDAEASSSSASKASKRLIDDLYMRKTLYRVKECEVEHPKLELARKLVSEQLKGSPDSRVIVFTNYRDTAEIVVNALSGFSGIVPIRFVGQASRRKDKGLTQKQQVEVLDKFRAGEYNVLVATSVAEEGLDIPSTDLVLFYEPIPSEIRSIQRKGRTGRQHKGRVIILVTKGTRDEAYYWSSKSKEKRMLNSMHGLEALLEPKNSKQSLKLSDFESKIFIPDHEQNEAENEIKINNNFENEDITPENKDLMQESSNLAVNLSGFVNSRDKAVDSNFFEDNKDAATDSNSLAINKDVTIDSSSFADIGNRAADVRDFTVDRGRLTIDSRNKAAGLGYNRTSEETNEDNCEVGKEKGNNQKNEEKNREEKSKEEKSKEEKSKKEKSKEEKSKEENVKERQKTFVYFETLSGKKTESAPETAAEASEIGVSPESLKMVVDYREAKSGVANTLDKLGVEVIFTTLEIGDYVVSDRLAVERKRTDDFVNSLVDGKRNLFAQLSDLTRVYEKPVLIIEGTELFTSRQINPNAIYGSLVSISIDFGVSLLYSRDEEETAAILKMLAKREQMENKREVNPHGKKSTSTLTEQQEYLVSAIADIGPKAARNLLLHFGSVEAIMKADAKELKNVKLIGPKRAAKIRELLETPYKE
ncbi:ATP-dependent RNA helicase, EIF-4A family [Methanosarcina barkeri 3]|uniref:ATP-dependent RNA helicase, EIF-4A family n=1 Tax=Methanosarcina barkeri 3 TaxID=1434107 RepID=A0A0E3SNC7_METBA|nr:DEAD/DEAH box helicase [Methanosarcina barkeri]AKB83981.1 ATP-dependent RNA helicase, EIF-4A family [Methanosarcina barkeri 3]